MAHLKQKHYEAIASILLRIVPERKTLGTRWQIVTRDAIAFNLADYFATDNPKFNRAKFLEQAGVTP